MTLEVVRSALAWSTVINMCLLVIWVIFFILARDWMYRMHGKWFQLPVEKFNSLHYTGMMIFKMAILLFNLAPYLALRIVG